MKNILPVLFFSLSIHGIAQNNSSDSSANCIAYWRKGETKVFNILHNKESTEAGKLKSSVILAYEAYIVILDSTSEGYKIQWTFHLPEKALDGSPSLGALPGFEGMKMVFTTSETGAFIELLNWQEVRDAYVKMMEVSLPRNMDSTAKAAINQAKEMFNTKQMVESTLIKEIQLFHFPYGYQFTTKEISEEAQLPNPFSEEPLPAVQTYQITELNPANEYFKLVVRQNIDKSGVEKLFMGLMNKTGQPVANAREEAKKLASSLEIKDYREFFISRVTGWVRKVYFERTANHDNINQVESYTIELKK